MNIGGDKMLNVKGNNRNDYVRIRLTSEEKELIKAESAKRGLTITDFIKICINEEMSRNKGEQ